MKVDDQPVRFYYNLLSKIKRSTGQPLTPQNHSNAEE
jgi:hypothetical protein